MSMFEQFTSSRDADLSAAGVAQRASQQFPSPWLDPASTELPTDYSEVMKFCELMWYSNGTYAQAMNRIAAYFVTKVLVEGVSSRAQDQWSEYLENEFHINKLMTTYGRNWLAYGSVVTSPNIPVQRMLVCSKCGRTAPLSRWKYKFENGKFRTEYSGCVYCKKNAVLTRADFRPMRSDTVRMRIWNPHQLKLSYNEVTERAVYRHHLTKAAADAIRRGSALYLDDTPWEFVDAALKRKPLRLHPEYLFHLRDEPLAGVRAGGAGLPRSMSNFRQAFLNQVYKRLNMVLAMEYSTPLRSITPAGSGTGNEFSDPTMSQDMSEISTKLGALISKWQRDPAAVHSFPIPLQYTAWGGEGLQMVSNQMQEQAMNELLTGIGIPVDFFRGTFKSERSFVPCLRLMERTWEELVAGYNAILYWLGKMLSQLLGWEQPILKLEKVTTADDIELRHILLELWMQNRVSGRTAMRTINLDPVDEQRKLIGEQYDTQEMADEEAAKSDKAFQAVQMMQAQPQGTEAPQGGDPSMASGDPSLPGGGMAALQASQNVPLRPEDILAEADRIAQKLLSMPEGERHAPMGQLREQNKLLHAAVLQQMEAYRQQVAQQAQVEASGGGGEQAQ